MFGVVKWQMYGWHHYFVVAAFAVGPFVVVDAASAAVDAASADSCETVDFVAKKFVRHNCYWMAENEFLFHSNPNAIVDLLNSTVRGNLG